MSFIKSLFFGSEGTYNVVGIEVKFQEEIPSTLSPPDLSGDNIIGILATKCLNNSVFCFSSQGYVHVFVHEMSHAIACRILTGSVTNVRIYTNQCVGTYNIFTPINNLPMWKQTAINLAGPMGSVAFCTLKLFAANRLKNYLPWPAVSILKGGAILWIFGELLYAYISCSQKDNGDFGKIVQIGGKIHLTVASTILVSQCVLGGFIAEYYL